MDRTIGSLVSRLEPARFILLEYIKEKFYAKPINDITKLRQRIKYASHELNVARNAIWITKLFLKTCLACIRVVALLLMKWLFDVTTI